MRSTDTFSIVFIVAAVIAVTITAGVPDAPWYAESVALLAAAVATVLTYGARHLFSKRRRQHGHEEEDREQEARWSKFKRFAPHAAREEELDERDEARGARRADAEGAGRAGEQPGGHVDDDRADGTVRLKRDVLEETQVQRALKLARDRREDNR